MRRFSKHIFCACLFLLVFIFFGVQDFSRAPIKYNVVLISIDSLRADHMSLYGYDRTTTPAIDAFAKRAVVFNSFFSTSMITPISEVSVHTGMYPFSSGVVNFESTLPPTVQTLAEVLKEQGWQTASFGSSVEFNMGGIRTSLSRGFDTYIGNNNTLNAPLPWYGRGGSRVLEALTWTKNAVKNKQPFFLWLHVGSVHWPYGQDEPPHFTDPSYDGRMRLGSIPEKGVPQLRPLFVERYGSIWQGKEYRPNRGVISADASNDLAYITDRYDDGIVKTDRELKPILDFLSESEIEENTIVIIQSEHGEGLGERGYVAHYDISDTETRTPLILKIPSVDPQHVDALASGVDVFPTVLSALGLHAPHVDGVDFMPFITGASATPPREEVYLTRSPLWERILVQAEPWLQPFVDQDTVHHFHDTAVRTNEWKLVHRSAREVERIYSWYGYLTSGTIVRPEYELYHVSVDPYERADVHAIYPEVVKELQSKLDAFEMATEGTQELPASGGLLQPYF